MKKQYRPNYKKLYPGVKISAEVLAVLKKSDHRMEYETYHIKNELHRTMPSGEKIITPAREISYELLLKYGYAPIDTSPSPEEQVLQTATINELQRCIALLDKAEQSLIRALFFEDLTEREYAQRTGQQHQSVNEHKQRILKKLKNMINI